MFWIGRRDSAQIFALRRDVNVGRPLDLVMIHFGRALEVHQLHDGVERRGLLQVRRPQRNVPQIERIMNRRPCPFS